MDSRGVVVVQSGVYRVFRVGHSPGEAKGMRLGTWCDQGQQSRSSTSRCEEQISSGRPWHGRSLSIVIKDGSNASRTDEHYAARRRAARSRTPLPSKQDISNQKRLETDASAYAADWRALVELASEVAHDLNTMC